MINYGHGIAGFVATVISLVHILLTVFISFTVWMILIHQQIYHRVQQDDKISLVLFAQIYFLIFINAVLLTATNIQTLLGDLHGTDFDSSWCRFNGYWITVIICAIYHTFVVQAIFRLGRIIYSNCRQLRLYWVFAIAAPILVVGASVLLCPLLIWQDEVYILGDYYCFLQLTNIRGMLWMLFICYGLPEFSVSIIYLRIIFFLRSQPNNLAQALKRRQQRDLLAIRRILVNVGLLITLGLPGIVVSMMAFSGMEHPLSHRILWLGIEISLTVLSIEMVMITPKLKKAVIHKWYRNRVLPIERSVQRRHNAADE